MADIFDEAALARELLLSVPSIRRARGYRLYLADGRRLVDLWQGGGSAILGHTAPGLLLTLKDTASRGLFFPFPHPSSNRLEKALLKLIPGRVVRVYADAPSVDAALGAAGFSALNHRDFHDPALSDVDIGTIAARWRPWLSAGFSSIPILSPVLPFPWAAPPVSLLLDPSIGDRFPPSDVLSPLVLAIAARAVNDLVAALPSHPSFGKVDAALASTSGRALWERRGRYLRRVESPSSANYKLFFKSCIESGFLFPPSFVAPIILPGELSPGEDAALSSVLLNRDMAEIL